MKNLIYQFELIQAIRNFFISQGFTDVLTPPLVQNPGMETHIHPFKVQSAYPQRNSSAYLHTSPEFHMKELLSLGMEKIFTISYCFRDEPISNLHRPQFLMIEWYRTQEYYTKLMDDCENLFRYCYQYFSEKKYPLRYPNLSEIKFERCTIQEIFQEYLHIDILEHVEGNSLAQLVQKDFPQLLSSNSSDFPWEDYYYLLFLNKIEPHLAKRPFLLLYEFPAPLAALSTLKKSDPRVCERFEIYMNGIEICNAFNELCNLPEQKKRFEFQKVQKKKLYGYDLPSPEVLYGALERGLPISTGIALGIERFLMGLTNLEPFYDQQSRD